VAIATIDPASTAGIAMTVLKYGMAVSFAGLVGQIIFTPYFWYIAVREHGARAIFFMGPREVYDLRQKYPLYRFLWNLSLVMGGVFLLSLFGLLFIFARYSL